MLQALAESGGLEWFQQHGCRTLVSFQVDNPLAKPVDPEFIGQHILSRSSLSTQVVPKLDPEERVGVVAELNGVTQIIEYSDLPPNVAADRLQNGRLKLFAGSIAIHAFDMRFLQDIASSSQTLPLHIAHKKVPFLNEKGCLIQPTKPNAFKFERFIFDLMPLAEKVTVVEIDPKAYSHWDSIRKRLVFGFDAFTDENLRDGISFIFTVLKKMAEWGIKFTDIADNGIDTFERDYSPSIEINSNDLTDTRCDTSHYLPNLSTKWDIFLKEMQRKLNSSTVGE